MPLQLDSLNGAIILSPEDGAGTAALTLPRVGIQPYSVNTANTFATQAEMVAGTEPGVRAFSPQRISQAIVAQRNFNWAIITGSYSAQNYDGLLVDTTNGAIVVTLPGSPTIGDSIHISDVSGKFSTNSLTLSRNSKPIMGLNEDMVCNISKTTFRLVYSNNTYGWRIIW